MWHPLQHLHGPPCGRPLLYIKSALIHFEEQAENILSQISQLKIHMLIYYGAFNRITQSSLADGQRSGQTNGTWIRKFHAMRSSAVISYTHGKMKADICSACQHEPSRLPPCDWGQILQHWHTAKRIFCVSCGPVVEGTSHSCGIQYVSWTCAYIEPEETQMCLKKSSPGSGFDLLIVNNKRENISCVALSQILRSSLLTLLG